jgi:hypothetical protein
MRLLLVVNYHELKMICYAPGLLCKSRLVVDRPNASLRRNDSVVCEGWLHIDEFSKYGARNISGVQYRQATSKCSTIRGRGERLVEAMF